MLRAAVISQNNKVEPTRNRRKKKENAFHERGLRRKAACMRRYAICVMNGEAKIANELLIVRLEQRFHRAAFAEDRFNIGHRAQIVQLPISLAKLQRGEASVSAVGNGLQFFVGAGFHDTSAGDDNDSIHMPHGGEPVSDDERSAPLH